MITTYKFIYLWLFVLIFYLSTLAQNDTSVIKSLTKRADVILTGKVIQKESSWNASKTRIYTKTTVQVEEYLKGTNKDNNIEITYPGGEVGDVGEFYTHMPNFEYNEEVLVFLKKDGKDNEYKVLNGEEGKITVVREAKTKEKITTSNLSIKDLKIQIKRFLSEH